MKHYIYTLALTICLNLNSQEPKQINDSIIPLDEFIIKGNTILGNKFVAHG